MNSALFDHQQLGPIICTLVIFSIPLAAVVGHYWLKVSKAKLDHELKQAMVEQGRSPEEIERILAADGSSARGAGPPGKSASPKSP